MGVAFLLGMALLAISPCSAQLERCGRLVIMPVELPRAWLISTRCCRPPTAPQSAEWSGTPSP